MKKYIIGSLMFLVFIVGGCTTEIKTTDSENKTTESDKKEITLEEAKEIALKEVDGKIVKEKQDSDDGVIYYEIDIVKDGVKYEFDINVYGTILSKEIDNDYVDKSNENYISQAKAEEIALKKVGGGTVIKSKLDSDDGIAYYEIEIVKDHVEYDIEISATSGDIVKYQIDD